MSFFKVKGVILTQGTDISISSCVQRFSTPTVDLIQSTGVIPQDVLSHLSHKDTTDSVLEMLTNLMQAFMFTVNLVCYFKVDFPLYYKCCKDSFFSVVKSHSYHYLCNKICLPDDLASNKLKN